MWWAIFKCVQVIIGSIVVGFIVSTTVTAWSPEKAPDHRLSDVKVYHSYPCPGKYTAISVAGEGSIQACVMGESTQVASYFSASGSTNYAISFPLENTFYRLDVCRGIWGCVYAEQNDTFAGIPVVYKNFAKHLKKTVEEGVVRYIPNDTAQHFSLNELGKKPLTIPTVATSVNGKWILVEIKGYGIFRVNVESLEMRRVIAPGVEYGYGSDPRMELAISNDGKTIAVVGLRMGVWVVMIDETCGDRPSEFMQSYFAGAVTGCRYLQTSTSAYISNFIHAVRPKFSYDNSMLSFDAYSNNTEPRQVTLFSNTAPVGTSNHVAIGDSFTSGEGEDDDNRYIGGATNRCHVSNRSYPFLVATSWNLTGVSLACSGATIDTARGRAYKTDQPAQLLELEAKLPAVTTVGIGGNDAGLIGKLKDCLGLSTCEWAETAESRRSTALEIKNLFPRLKEFYHDVKIRTQGPVIVVGYPLIISLEAGCASPIGLLLNETERIFMNQAIRYLNQVIYAAANDSGAVYADVEHAFSGEWLCAFYDSPVMNSIRMGDDFPNITSLPFLKVIGAESFHPKPEGHVRIAGKILQSFPNIYRIDSCIGCTVPTDVPAPDEYWDSAGDTITTRRAMPFLNKITIKKGDAFEISFPALTFLPSSDVVIELHSEIKKLGTVKSADDGSLQVTIPAIEGEIGHHSVHAIGKSFAGNDIDVYDFVTIEGDAVSPVATGVVLGETPKSAPTSQPSVAVRPVTKDTSPKVLGLSTEGDKGPNISPLQNKNTEQSPGKVEGYTAKAYDSLIGIGSGVLVVLLAGSVYVYYRLKTVS
jgi:lysophospholipase L1-like esterase